MRCIEILLSIGFLCTVSTADEIHSLFDDLIIDKKLDIAGQPSIYDTSAGSRCTGIPCRKERPQKHVITPKPNPKIDHDSRYTSLFGDQTKISSSRNASLFDSQTKLSSSLKSSKESYVDPPLQQKFKEARPTFQSQEAQNGGSLFDPFMASNSSPSRAVTSRVSQNSARDDIDMRIDILQKEKEAIENLPDTIWKQALENSKQGKERESSEKVLNLFADSTKKFTSLFTRDSYKPSSNNLPLTYRRTVKDADIRALAGVVNKGLSEDVNNISSLLNKDIMPYIENVKENRLSDLLLALKIVQLIDDSKTQAHKKENDKEMELLLAKSIFKRSVKSTNDLSSPQRQFLSSVMKAMHGTLKKEEREVVSDSISRIFTLPETDLNFAASSRESIYELPYRRSTPRPIVTSEPTPPPVGPPPSTFAPVIVGPPSPPPRPTGRPMPPSPPVRLPSLPNSPFLIDSESGQESEGFFLADSASSQQSGESFFLAPNQDQFFITGNIESDENDFSDNVQTPVLQPQLPLESHETSGIDSSEIESIRDNSLQDFHNDDSSNERANSPVYNYHYHYFSHPDINSGSSNPRDDSSTRVLSLPQSSSPEENLRSPSQQSSYSSLRTESRSRLSNPQNLRPIIPPRDPQSDSYEAPPFRDPPSMSYGSPPVRDPQPPRDPPLNSYGSPPLRDPPPNSYVSPPIRDPLPPRDPPRNSYGSPPPRDPPSNSYGSPPIRDPLPPRDPPTSYGSPPLRDPLPPRDPIPVRTRVVFLERNKFKGKKHKGKKGVFSAFRVFDDNYNRPNVFSDESVVFDDYSSDFILQRDILRDEYWRSREKLYRQQQEAFELQRLQDEIELQEQQRDYLKKGLFKSIFKSSYGGGFKDMFYKGAMALGALSLAPLSTMFGRKRRSLEDIPNIHTVNIQEEQILDILNDIRNFDSLYPPTDIPGR